MRAGFPRMLVVIAVSGACSLVYQVAWLRLLRLIFGSSTAASAAVVAMFMGGLGLGGWFFGRRAGGLRRPLAYYARLETGIALAAALSPFLVWIARAVYLETGGVFSLGTPLASAVRILLAALVLGLPTTLMGGTLPVVVQALERERDLGRRRVAWLYGVNTLGAVTGACLTNFYLLELLGIRGSLWAGAAVNLALAGAVALLARGEQPEQPATRPETSSETRSESEPTGNLPALLGERKLLFAVAALVGCVFFLMELVWYRMLAPILGGSTYTMGLILAVALFGIALGGLLYALGGERRRPTVATLAATCALEALCLGLPLLLGDDLALAAAYTRHLAALGFGGLVLSWTLVTAVVVLPAAVVAGYQFPVLVALLGQGRQDAGRDVGYAYAWNTAGAICGSLAGGFGLVPLLGAPQTWRFTVLVTALLAVALWAPAVSREGLRQGVRGGILTLGAALLAAGLAFLTEGPTAFWRHVPIGAGRALTDYAGPSGYQAYRKEIQWATRAEADGRESSIALQVVADPGLIVNGKSDGAALGDAATTLMSGLIGAALHPEPESALVIGLGIGTTAGWFTTVDSIRTVDVVELEPAVVELTRPLGPATFHLLDSPKTRLFLGDGRELILTQRRTWDLIFSEPSNPYRAGVADLFSQDFYRAARRRLAPGGLFLQWLQGYEVDAELVQTVYATLSSEFPAVETWQVGSGDLLLVASEEPVSHDPARIARRLGEPTFVDGMRKVWGVDGLAGLYSGFLGTGRLTAALDHAAPPSTDDRPRIELGFARKVGQPRFAPIGELRAVARSLGAHRPPGLDDAGWAASRELLRLRVVQGSASDPHLLRASTIRDSARKAYVERRYEEAVEHWRAMEEPPVAYWDRLALAASLAHAGSEDCLPLLEELEGEDPGAVAAIRARLHVEIGRPDRALTSLLSALDRLRSDPWLDPHVLDTLPDLVVEVARTGPASAARLYEALEPPFAVGVLDLQRLLTRAFLLSQLPDFEGRCADFFTPLEPDVLWLSSLLQARFRCYEAVGHPRRATAARELESFLSLAPRGFVTPAETAPDPSPSGAEIPR